MKKLISIIAIAFSISANSQTYDTSIHNIKCAKITGFKATYVDALNATRLGIVVSNDDLITQAHISYILLDSLGTPVYTGNYILSGSLYTSWNRTINQLFNSAAQKLGFTLK